MPADIKTAPANKHVSLEGSVFTFQNDAERFDAIDKAFDYRGDVTLTLVNNGKIEGFIFNRDAQAKPPRIEVFVKGSDEPQVIPYSDITGLVFSGKDTANGKSWEAWANKKEEERKAEAARLEEEAKRLGHL
jgi:hypothetical protein